MLIRRIFIANFSVFCEILTYRGNIMTQEDFDLNESLDTVLKYEELQQIIKAIIAGKYSWACVLILGFTGYKPVEYIPYRTYIRLLKNNSLVDKAKFHRPKHHKLEMPVGSEQRSSN